MARSRRSSRRGAAPSRARGRGRGLPRPRAVDRAARATWRRSRASPRSYAATSRPAASPHLAGARPRGGRRAARGQPPSGRVVTRRVEHSIFRHSFLHLDRLKYAPGADRVLCVSERVRDVLRADGLPADRLVVVPDGVDVAAHRAPARRSRRPARVARDPGRRLADRHRRPPRPRPRATTTSSTPSWTWASTHRDAHLLLVGEGPARGDLDRQVCELGLGRRVTFAGFRDDVPDLLHALDVFAFPSTSEGLGSSVLEAMAAGVPVVATTAGGIPEAVRDGADGLLVAPAARRSSPTRSAGCGRSAEAARRGGSRRPRSASASLLRGERMVAGTRAAYAAAVTRRAPPAPRPGGRRGGRASSGSS